MKIKMSKNTLTKTNKSWRVRPFFLIYIFSLVLIISIFFTGCFAGFPVLSGSKNENTGNKYGEADGLNQENFEGGAENTKAQKTESNKSNVSEESGAPEDGSVLPDKPTVIAEGLETESSDFQGGKSSESHAQENSSQINPEPPRIQLEIIEGPRYAQDNNICFYRIRANVWGQPYPQIIFNRDDSNGSWGENVAQVNLLKDEIFNLICDVSNSQGTASSSINIAWKDYQEQAGSESGQGQQTSSQNPYDNPANYLIDVNLTDQEVNVFYLGNLVKSMPCSGGRPETPTPLGTYKTNQKIYWAYVPRFGQGAYYWTRFYGAYLFHSVPYDENKNLLTEELAKIGTPASHGCIRLYLEDAKWMYETLPLGIEVKIHF